MMSLGRSKRRAEKQVSLFILILFAVPVDGGVRRGGGQAGAEGTCWRLAKARQGLLGNGKGCQAGPTANIRSSHLCSQKPGVLPKASFRLHGMITLDVGQLLRALSSLHPSSSSSSFHHSPFMLPPLARPPLPLSLFPLLSIAYCQTCSSCHGGREWNIKKKKK